MVSIEMEKSSLFPNQIPVYNSSWDDLSFFGPTTRILKNSAQIVGRVVYDLCHNRGDGQNTTLHRIEEEKQRLHSRLKNALTLEEWKFCAKELDVLENNEAWKFDTDSNEFDAPLIEMRMRQLDQARETGDIKQMLCLIRTALSRDLGAIGNVRLYTHSYIGTKDLIERYIDSAVTSIRWLVEMSKHETSEDIGIGTILEQVLYSRQAFGRSALLLSGGGTFGMNHIGVLKALFYAKLLPRVISGSSAGSIVCSVLCTKIDSELPELLASFAYGDLAVFTDKDRPDGILDKLQRLLTQGYWIDNKHLIRVMKDLIGDMTFQEAYNRTRRILNIFVSSASIYELPQLLNYITSPNVMIWSAVAASCSVPMIFASASLLVKDPVTGENTPWDLSPQQFIDGSVEGDVPMARLAEMFNVNHFIVSQVNPHVLPFLLNEERITTKTLKISSSDWINTITKLVKDEALHRFRILTELGIFPNLFTKLHSVLNQKYTGDITILPEIELSSLPLILTNPTTDFMLKAYLCGERALWPKMSRIRNACAVEMELDAAVQALRARLVFGTRQIDHPSTPIVEKKPKIPFLTVQRRGYSTNYIQTQPSNDSNSEAFEQIKKRKLTITCTQPDS